MPKIRFIRPLDQPIGTHRLLEDLIDLLNNTDYYEFLIISAYAKVGPLYRLSPYIKKWRNEGKTIKAIFGIDQQGTSYEALDFSLTNFNEIYITQEPKITFHPKAYIFNGASNTRAFIGSNNLTVGGTERNFEATIDIELDTRDDTSIITQLREYWEDLLPDACHATRLLDRDYLEELLEDEDIIDEKRMRERYQVSETKRSTPKRKPRHSQLKLKPASFLPKIDIPKLVNKREEGYAVTTETLRPDRASVTSPIAAGLAMQIIPHHNGEIFLSVSAVHQYPSFFGWPFTGKTTPKKSNNPAYPQRIPDPIVNITVYGQSEDPVKVLNSFSLNTIYYSTKSEIRITASPLVSVVPEYSIMVMELSQTYGIDYDITIYRPDNQNYLTWLNTCNQQMPGGGRTSRRYGWF